jgi:ubiquinone biosynthesis protein
VRAFKDKAPFWIERMPEIPELSGILSIQNGALSLNARTSAGIPTWSLIHDSRKGLQQSKQLQTSVDTIVRDMHVRHVRQGQSRYLFGG